MRGSEGVGLVGWGTEEDFSRSSHLHRSRQEVLLPELYSAVLSPMSEQFLSQGVAPDIERSGVGKQPVALVIRVEFRGFEDLFALGFELGFVLVNGFDGNGGVPGSGHIIRREGLLKGYWSGEWGKAEANTFQRNQHQVVKALLAAGLN